MPIAEGSKAASVSRFPLFLNRHINPCTKTHDPQAKKLKDDQLEVYLWISSDLEDCPACARGVKKVEGTDTIELKRKKGDE